ncbi:TlpA family protein disulfide reductase [Microlunatus soli]|uniref:Thiol-disulfide isomerase or thioredoxin n=1 Tax=Microlunatus soli TaxID=630515 RepID=A0A1H1T0L6_9ACTN|nr:TlpA disulfide reductase family protein [Microlunatus soli]SDS53714.1 Thiol-disulfide isomerase or thioredoxin [Microlunatus soli]
MMPAARPAAVAAGLLILLTTGCSALSPSATPGTTPSAQPPGASTSSDPSLAAAKKQAGIADCPTSDADAQAQPDGLPAVTLPCLGGGRSVNLAGLRGTPTVINIWAQWCGPCRQEAPHLRAVAERADNKINFLGIDYDDPDPAAAIDYAGRAKWSYPQLQDQQKSIKPGLRILGPPQTLFIDESGRIAYRHNGPITSDRELIDAIDDHLGVRL